MLMDHPEQTCSTCTWWTRRGCEVSTSSASIDASKREDIGSCRRKPPQVVKVVGNWHEPVVPTTHEDWFCGDWEGTPADGGDGDDGERVIVFPIANKLAA